MNGGSERSDRGFRHTRGEPDHACDQTPDQRGQRRTRPEDDRACDATPGAAGAGEAGGAGEAIARIATAQQGTISKQQLLDTGLRSNAVDRRADSGTLHRVFRGVYLVGHEALAPYARESAALLACGEHALFSHSSAAFLWGIVGPSLPDANVHVTVVGGRRRSRPGLRVHYAQRLHPADRRRVHTLPVTAPALTLFDLAASNHPDLERAFAEAHAKRLVTPDDVTSTIDRAGSRSGVRALRALIDDNASGFTRSQAERLLRKLIRDARIPQPRFNFRFRQYELDACWPEQRLVVEVDGFGFHGHRAQFERDRRKDMELTAAGYRVIRVTWNQLKHEPFAVVAAIVAALSLGREPG